MNNFCNHFSSFIVILIALPTSVQTLVGIYLTCLLLRLYLRYWSSDWLCNLLLLRYYSYLNGRCTNILLLLLLGGLIRRPLYMILLLRCILSVLHRNRRRNRSPYYGGCGHHLLLRCRLRSGSRWNRMHLRWWRCLRSLHC